MSRTAPSPEPRAVDPTGLLRYFGGDPDTLAEFRAGVDACLRDFHDLPRRRRSIDAAAAAWSGARVPDEAWEASRYLELLRSEVVGGAVRVGAPRFVGHMTSVLPGYLGELSRLLVALNQNVVKVETSSVLTLLERQVLAMMHRVVFEEGDAFYARHTQARESYLGIITSGGTLANLTAMWLARNAALRAVDGFDGMQRRGFLQALDHYGYRDAVIIGSELMHYSVDKLASIMGFGHDQILKIPGDDTGAVRVDLLEATLRQCKQDRRLVVALVGIAATTETGAVDDLQSLAEVAKAHGVHFHVDAAWGGPILFSAKHRHLLAGIEHADTVTICGHKQLYLPQGTSMVLCREPSLVRHIRAEARYQARAGSYDLGKVSAEGSRPANALYLHASLHLLGTEGFGYLIDEGIRKAALFADQVRARPAFELLQEPKTNLVVYRYRPPDLRGELDDDDERRVNAVNEVLQERQFSHGETFISGPRCHAQTADRHGWRCGPCSPTRSRPTMMSPGSFRIRCALQSW